MENIDSALGVIQDNCLGQLYAQFPGENSWEVYYVFFRDSQLQFLSSIKNHAFRYSYIVHRVVTCKISKYVSTADGGLRKIDVLLLTHQFDNEALFITHPLIFQDSKRRPEYTANLLEKIQAKLHEYGSAEPQGMLPMDQTNRHSWGKVRIHIGSISNFPYNANLFVKISLGAWVIQSKRIPNDKQDWNQTFFVPKPHNFVTLKLEVVNLQSDGWFKEHFKQYVICSYDIRLPDINKEPFDREGNVSLPVPEVKEPKKMGLGLIEKEKETESKVVARQCMLHVTIKDMTRLDAMISHNPNRDIVEDRKLITEYSIA